MKFLVCREALLRPGNTVSSSDRFPMVVEITEEEFEREGYAAPVYRALDTINQGYRPDYSYVVVPMHGAFRVSFEKPKPIYDINVRPYGA